MFFRKKNRKRGEEPDLPPVPDDLDDDFGFETSEVVPPKDDPSKVGRSMPAPGRPAADSPLLDPRPSTEAGGDIGRELDDRTLTDRPGPASIPRPAAPIPPPREFDTPADVTVFQAQPVSSTASSVAWLVAASGPLRGQDFRISEGGLSIGIGPDCGLRVEGDTYVSTRHAELTLVGGAYILRDLGSTNGTFRNDERITEARIEDDDRIRFGLSRFVFKVARL